MCMGRSLMCTGRRLMCMGRRLMCTGRSLFSWLSVLYIFCMKTLLHELTKEVGQPRDTVSSKSPHPNSSPYFGSLNLIHTCTICKKLYFQSDIICNMLLLHDVEHQFKAISRLKRGIGLTKQTNTCNGGTWIENVALQHKKIWHVKIGLIRHLYLLHSH